LHQQTARLGAGFFDVREVPRRNIQIRDVLILTCNATLL
jgi:hypothetical protein